MRWIRRLMPRDVQFFGLLEHHVELLAEAAAALGELLGSYDDIAGRAGRIQRVDDLERQADRLVQEAAARLHRSRVAPFDGKRIYALLTELDDILDLMQDVAESLLLYDIQRIPTEALQLAELAQAGCGKVQRAVHGLRDLHDATGLVRLCDEVDAIESDADRVLRAAMSRLFRHETDVRELIKLKAIYELLESVTDRCKDAATTVEGLVLEHAR
ncbi:MAG: DUF47 family protein [Burkholderiales bacterium]|nr:MAG: DUF47 family protein [Burkholderiales bacterium]